MNENVSLLNKTYGDVAEFCNGKPCHMFKLSRAATSENLAYVYRTTVQAFEHVSLSHCLPLTLKQPAYL